AYPDITVSDQLPAKTRNNLGKFIAGIAHVPASLVAEGLDDLIGNIDLGAGINRLLEYEIKVFLFRDIQDHLLRALLQSGQLLVAPHVQIFPQLPLRPFKITV